MVNCLLIESNIPERHKLAGVLESFGLQCTEHAEAGAALVACNDNPPDVVVMQQTDETSEFLRLVGSQGRMPVVILYGEQGDFNTTGRAILDGASEFLVKPFDRDLLRFKLQQSGVFSN